MGIGFGCFVDDSKHAFHDVINVGEIPFHFSVVEDIDGAVFQDGLGKQEEGHVRATPRAVDGEKPETRAVKPEEAAVAVGHEFIGFLAGGIEGNRVVHIVVDRNAKQILNS